MPKVKIFNLITASILMNFCISNLHAQPMISQVIEQAKKNKLLEMFPPISLPVPLSLANTTSNLNIPQFHSQPSLPALWSLSGINEKLVAEVLINEQIQSFKVVRGFILINGWTVMAGDTSSLTLKLKEKTITLFPPAPGTSGAEFYDLKKVKKIEADGTSTHTFSAPRSSQQEFINPSSVHQGPPANMDAARLAASSLPKRP